MVVSECGKVRTTWWHLLFNWFITINFLKVITIVFLHCNVVLELHLTIHGLRWLILDRIVKNYEHYHEHLSPNLINPIGEAWAYQQAQDRLSLSKMLIKLGRYQIISKYLALIVNLFTVYHDMVFIKRKISYCVINSQLFVVIRNNACVWCMQPLLVVYVEWTVDHLWM